jgi:CHAT domain-containing protein
MGFDGFVDYRSIVERLAPRSVVSCLGLVLIALAVGCRAAERSPQAALARVSLARFSKGQEFARCTWPGRMHDERLRPPRCEPAGSRNAALDERARKRIQSRESDVDGVQRGQWRLVAGGVSPLVQGIQGLKRARSLGPPDPDLENDFAASFLRLAELADDSYSLFFALERLLAEIEKYPRHRLLRFNRAVAWDLLGVTGKAVQSWQEFLATKEESLWAAEARRRLDVLQQSLPEERGGPREWNASRLSAARERIVEQIIPAWSDAVLKGKMGEAAPLLQEAERLAAAAGDKLSQSALALLRSAALRPGDRQLRALAEAHRLLAQGIASRRRFATDDAVTALTVAGQRLARLGSPLSLLADYHRAMAIYHVDRYPEAEALLREVQKEAEERHELLVQGLSTKSLGVIAQVTGHPSAATKLYREALEGVRRSGDLRERINVASILADGLLAAGQDKEAWRILHGALRAAWQHDDYLPRYVVSAAGAAMAEKRGFPYLATAMTRLSLTAIREAGSPAAIADSATWYASSLVATGHLAAARTVLQQVRPLIDRLDDAATSRRAVADLDCAEGRLMLSAGRAEAALPRLQDGADYYEEVSLLTNAAPCRAAEGAAVMALGDPRGASELLEKSLILASRLDGFLPRVETFYGAGDPTVSLLESALTLNIERGKPWEALRLAALALRRSTPGQSSVEAPAVSGLQAAAARLKGSHRIVLFVYCLPRNVIAWRLDGQSIAVHRAAVAQSEVSAAVARFIETVQRGEPVPAELQRTALGALLLGNLLKDVEEGTTLVIVSTADLAALPWSFLEMPGSGPLLSHWPVALAPNLDLALAPARRIPAAAKDLLVVANPTIPGEIQAPPLPHAEEEAAQLLRLFQGRAAALVGERATKQNVLEGISRFTAVHMGVHGISDPYAPRASHLILRGDDGRRDALTVDEILGMDLRRTRIVVLAACNSSFRSTALATNAFGLGEAFLAAGARAVVASGWAVDDAATGRLMANFYRALADGATVADALRLAQLTELRQAPNGSLRNYAAFRVLGDPTVTLSTNQRSSEP